MSSSGGAFDKTIYLFVQDAKALGADALRQAAIAERDKVLQEQTARRGVKPLTHIAVDGVITNDLSAIKPTSRVFEYWDYRAEIIQACFDELRARSPVGPTGQYRDHHFAIIDDEVLPALIVPPAERLENVSRIVVTNPRPQSRRLEVGKTESGDSFVKTVDPHIYESAMRVVRAEFGAVAKISFNYISLETTMAASVSWRDVRAFTSGGTSSRRRAAQHHQLRSPAIFIEQA